MDRKVSDATTLRACGRCAHTTSTLVRRQACHTDPADTRNVHRAELRPVQRPALRLGARPRPTHHHCHDHGRRPGRAPRARRLSRMSNDERPTGRHVVTGGTPWWGTLLATAVTAAAALLGTWLASRRQDKRAKEAMRSTGREEWFRRLQWAEELAATNDNDGQRATGRAILTELTRSQMAPAGTCGTALRSTGCHSTPLVGNGCG